MNSNYAYQRLINQLLIYYINLWATFVRSNELFLVVVDSTDWRRKRDFAVCTFGF